MTEPTVVIRPSTTEDVAAAVRRAKQESLPVTVVSGGHGPWSHGSSPGLRIELSELNSVDVDGTTVRVGGGAVWGDVAATLAGHGLAISSGDTATVGVGGLTLGGGVGWMVRSWGLAADQLIGVEVVTADGDVIEASADENPDLFWALRGGGGNFGVVTRFDFAAHRLDGIAFAETRFADPASVLRAVRDLLTDAPRELTVTYMDVPPMDPSAPAGASLSAVWAGADAERLRAVLEPITRLDGVEADITTPAYRDILMEPPVPAEGEEQVPPGFVGGNGLYARLDDDLIDRLLAFRAAYPASVLFLRSLGGAFGDVTQEATAFPAREATWFVMAGAFDIPGLVDDDTRAEILADWAVIERNRIAEYSNFSPTERPEAVAGMFAPAARERLREIKRTWDPENLFRRNHNIVP
ncbi:FAD-binding oxidoreductase [Microbacterium sp. CIAB417]|uniref:FAD-binding oxidoreductase n=1 Tax=Microbacterium sp. CIAB417 TaxID=2860287 RepID=UPI001FABB051|nr:FAD-binding oxidoreductase [Microbacterium sp. CIAB417]